VWRTAKAMAMVHGWQPNEGRRESPSASSTPNQPRSQATHDFPKRLTNHAPLTQPRNQPGSKPKPPLPPRSPTPRPSQ
jgi:hypothetical protein